MRLRQSVRSPKVVIGAVIVVAMVLCALFAPQIAPNDPENQDLVNMLLPPMWSAGGTSEYPFGTDSLGRCILSQMIYGARVALFVGFFAAIGAMLFGTTLALISGYFGGWVDRGISHLVDLWMSLPPVVLSLTLMVGFGTGVGNVILSIVLVDWTRFCRVVRSEVIVVTRKDFVAAAKLLGFGDLRIILREILPSVTPLIITLFTLQVGIGVIVEAILSFVGLERARRRAGVGHDDRRRAQLHVSGALGHHPADHRDVRDRAGLQPARRGPARFARSAAAAEEPLMSVLSFDDVTVTAKHWRPQGRCAARHRVRAPSGRDRSVWSANPVRAKA